MCWINTTCIGMEGGCSLNRSLKTTGYLNDDAPNPSLGRRDIARIARINATVHNRQQRLPLLSPDRLAKLCHVRALAVDLPDGLSHATDGDRLYYRRDADPASTGWRIYRGVAEVLLAQSEKEYGPMDVWAVAAHLAAPPLLAHRLGIEAVTVAQPWAPADQLILWWRLRKSWR